MILFVISWLPLYSIFAVIKLGGPIESDSFQEKILMIMAPLAQWLGASNSCINPMLYCFFNKKYRNGFMALLRSRKCCGNSNFQFLTFILKIQQLIYKIIQRYSFQRMSEFDIYYCISWWQISTIIMHLKKKLNKVIRGLNQYWEKRSFFLNLILIEETHWEMWVYLE